MGLANRSAITSRIRPLGQVVLPALAGSLMLCAGLLPWLIEPLQAGVPAWQLPFDLGWQVRTGLFNYGLLCTLCALYPFFIAYRTWQAGRNLPARARLSAPAPACFRAALLCCLPVVLLLWQYLFVDFGSLTQLARHEAQYLLLTQNLGYGIGPQIASIADPTSLDLLTLHGRLSLFFDQVAGGFFLPWLSAFLLVLARSLFPKPATRPARARRQPRLPVAAIALALAILFGRAPLALLCNDQGRAALSIGDYVQANGWLGAADTLNPLLEQVALFHIERGQAHYFLYPKQPDVESYAYLASAYQEQQDYQAAYQALLSAWQLGDHSPWLLDELSTTLVKLVNLTNPLQGAPFQRVDNESAALPWLNELVSRDPGNIYAHYMLGRIQYDLHNYSQCAAEMSRVIALSRNTTVLSSAYTYLGLSSAGRGDYANARTFLLQAVALDPEYRNNTAREELSGLR